MTGSTLTVARSEAAVSTGVRAREAPVVPVAGWLLVAVALDLVVTRTLVRLAIFVPKAEPWSTVASWMGGVGAVTDVLVVVAGLGTLLALLLRSGHGSVADRLLAAATAIVAASGLGMLVAPPSSVDTIATDVLICAIALLAIGTCHPSHAVPSVARLSLALLALAVAAPPVARALSDGGLGYAAPPDWLDGLGPTVVIVGQWCLVFGALTLGLAGLWTRRDAGLALGPLVAGLVVGGLVLLAYSRSPVHTDQVLIWSVGLTGVVPVAMVALAVGLAVVGVPSLARSSWPVAVGGSIVLLAGYGLAANGLVLASLVGLLVARADRVSPDVASARVRQRGPVAAP